MRSSYSIDIKLLHDKDVFNHILLTYNITLIWIHLMSICALEKNRLSIEKEESVLDTYITETDVY